MLIRTLACLLLAVTLWPASSAMAQGAVAECPECQPLADRLNELQHRLRSEETAFRSMQNRLIDEEGRGASAAALQPLVAQVEEARARVLELSEAVRRAAQELRACNAKCPKKPREMERPQWRPVDEADEPVPAAACQACQPHVDRVKALQAERAAVRATLKQLQKALAEHWDRMQQELRRLEADAAAGRTSVSSGFSGLQWMGDGFGLGVQESQAWREHDRLTAAIVAALESLAVCNLACGEPAQKSQRQAPPPPELPAPPAPPAPRNPVPPPTGEPCDDCKQLGGAMKHFEQERDRHRAALERLADEEPLHEARHQLNQDRLKQLQAQGRGSSDEAAALRSEIDGYQSAWQARDDAARALERQFYQAAYQASAAERLIERCSKACTRTSSIFLSPWPYVGGGALAAAGLLGGGGDAPNAAAPPAPGPQQSAPPAGPPVSTTPAGRQPAATHTVTNCLCVFDSALLNGVLRFCESTAPVRVSVTAPGVMEVALPSALPVLRGPFNATTGEFQLTGVTANGQALTFGGTIDQNGGFANAFLHVDLTTMRRTSYSFATVGR